MLRPGNAGSNTTGHHVQAARLSLAQLPRHLRRRVLVRADSGQVRDGAWVADVTGLLDLSSWPAGMRVIVCTERPHPGAQLRFTDLDGHGFTAFATDGKKGQLADLELRHRRRSRCEDRIRNAKDTGLRNPLSGFAQNQL